MRNKKILAIITLVAFMMTLLPLAAFANAPQVDRFASILRVDKTKVEADGEKKIKFTVYVRNSDNSKATGETIYVASERGTTDRFFEKGSKVAKEAALFYEFTDENNDGKIEFELASQVAGEAQIAVGLKNNVYTYLTDSNTTAAAAEIIGTRIVTFEATKASDVELVKVEPRRGSAIADLKEQLDQNGEPFKGERVYGTRTDALQTADLKANGVDYYELTFHVKNSSNAPIEGEKITFSGNRNNVSFNRTEATTDVVGEAKVRVFADRAGVYEVEAAIGSNQAKVWLTFGAAEINELVLVSSVDPLIAIDEEKPAKFKLELKDTNGNKIDPKGIGLAEIEANDMLEFEWITEPSGSDLDNSWVWEKTGDVYNFIKITDDNYIEVSLPTLDEEGKYVLRVNIENGKYVDVTFEGREQGDIVELKLSYDTATLQLNGVSSIPKVKRVDKAGVTVDVPDNRRANDLSWSISDFRVLKAGKRDLNAQNGVLNITADDDYIGTYTVTVIDKQNNLTASFTIVVGNEVTGIDVELPSFLATQKETKVTLKTLDANGNNVALGTDVKNVEFNAYVTNQPAGARVTVEPSYSDDRFAKDLKEKGVASIDVFSREAGEATVVVVVTVTNSDDTKVNFSKVAKLTFAEEKAPVQIASRVVTLFIGSNGAVVDGKVSFLDVAPFIQDNRTFVPVRFVGEALGAEIKWDEATQTVTMVRDDNTITLTIGSNILVSSDGTAIVADVAPFITDAGRTVLPFRAVAEAFGAEVEAGFNADGTTSHVVFTQK